MSTCFRFDVQQATAAKSRKSFYSQNTLDFLHVIIGHASHSGIFSHICVIANDFRWWDPLHRWFSPSSLICNSKSRQNTFSSDNYSEVNGPSSRDTFKICLIRHCCPLSSASALSRDNVSLLCTHTPPFVYFLYCLHYARQWLFLY